MRLASIFALRFGVVASVSLVCFLCATMRAAAQWTGASHDTLTHDAIRDEVEKQSLAVDASNVLHAVWKKTNAGGGWRLLYSKKAPAGRWSPQREVADSNLMIFRYALAVNPQTGMPYVAYEQESAVPREILLVRDSAGTWVHTRITTNSTDDVSPSLALDSAGFVHLAWIAQDTALNWKIGYATNRSGVWQTQLLTSSEPGPFGSGAEPFIAVTPAGVAHIFYRGGDFGMYHIHHAWNAQPGGTAWSYEIVTTPNGNDFSARAVIDAQGTIHLLASGNDGFGFPPRAYYLTKPATGSWSTPQHANQGGNGWGGSLVIDRSGTAHLTWDETSGNIYTGNLFYATNKTGTWTSTSILSDGKTYSGSLVLDGTGKGHAIAFNGETFQTQEILVMHSSGVLTSVHAEESTRADAFTLYQNYPNPCFAGGARLPDGQGSASGGNPTTIIGFRIPVSGFTSLKVYDVLGREVATLIEGIQDAGFKSVALDADNLPSGVYFYKLQAGTFAQTKKLLLLR